MDIDVKKLSRQQYIGYFKIWFIVLGIVLALAAVLFVGGLLKPASKSERENTASPSDRVYDNADVLSKAEEKKLEKLIEETENRIQCDIILVTINQPVENLDEDDMENYGYRYDDWEMNMRDLADDFYVENLFGYDEDEYSGVLLLMNWYSDEDGSQRGAALATDGSVYEKFGDREINQVIDEVVDVILDGGTPYKAYKAYVNKVVDLMDDRLHLAPMWIFVVAALSA